MASRLTKKEKEIIEREAALAVREQEVRVAQRLAERECQKAHVKEYSYNNMDNETLHKISEMNKKFAAKFAKREGVLQTYEIAENTLEKLMKKFWELSEQMTELQATSTDATMSQIYIAKSTTYFMVREVLKEALAEMDKEKDELYERI